MSNPFGSGSSRDAADSTKHYDDAAFSLFLITVLGLILVPWSVSYFRRGRRWLEARNDPLTKNAHVLRAALADETQDGSGSHDDGFDRLAAADVGGFDRAAARSSARQKQTCLCDGCMRKHRLAYAKSSVITRADMLWFALYALLMAAAAALVFFALTSEGGAAGEGGAQPVEFDPYAILGLEPGAEENDVRKAYRRLSREHHPDKNPDDEVAAEKYLQLTRAKDTLTDPAVREKWEKYGNPDGPQAVTVGIALPSFLVDEDNNLYILFAYIALIFGMVYAGFRFWQSMRSDATQAKPATLKEFFDGVAPELRTTKLLELVARAEEFSDEIEVREGDEAALDRLKKHIVAERQVVGKNKGDKKGKGADGADGEFDYADKTMALFEAHLSRATATQDDSALSRPLKRDLERVLLTQERLLSGLFEVIKEKQRISQNQWPAMPSLLDTIYLKQMLVQGVWGEKARREEDTTFLQLPHIEGVLDKLLTELKTKKWRAALAHAYYSLIQPPTKQAEPEAEPAAASSADKVVDATDGDAQDAESAETNAEDPDASKENTDSAPARNTGGSGRGGKRGGGRGGKKGGKKRRPAKKNAASGAGAASSAAVLPAAPTRAPGEKSLQEQFVDALEASTAASSTKLTTKQRQALIADNHPTVVKAEPASQFRMFCLLEPEQRRELLAPLLSEEQMEDIECVVRRLPRDLIYKPAMPPYVVVASEGEKDDWYNSPRAVATMVITLSRPSIPSLDDEPKKKKKNSLPDGPPIPVHCPHYPKEADETWWVVVSDRQGKLLYSLRPTTVRDNTEVRIQLMMPDRPCTIDYRVRLMSDSYVGFDSERTCRVRVQMPAPPQKGPGQGKRMAGAFYDAERDEKGAQSTLYSDSDSDSDSESESEQSKSDFSESDDEFSE